MQRERAGKPVCLSTSLVLPQDINKGHLEQRRIYTTGSCTKDGAGGGDGKDPATCYFDIHVVIK